MTVFQNWTAKLGALGTLAVLLALSLAANVWQVYRAGGSTARCETAQAAAGTAVLQEAAERDTEALAVADESDDRADAAVAEVQAKTIDRQETVRVVYRTIPAPAAGCPRALPERVRDTLADAAAAANRPM